MSKHAGYRRRSHQAHRAEARREAAQNREDKQGPQTAGECREDKHADLPRCAKCARTRRNRVHRRDGAHAFEVPA